MGIRVGGCLAGRGREVKGGVAVEEANGFEGGCGVLDGHHRPVLRTRNVGAAEGAPENEVLVFQRPDDRSEVLDPPGYGC
nr:hypothetical protein [Actinomadura soli]